MQAIRQLETRSSVIPATTTSATVAALFFPIDEQGRDISWYEKNDFGNSKSYHVLGKKRFYGPIGTTMISVHPSYRLTRSWYEKYSFGDCPVKAIWKTC